MKKLQNKQSRRTDVAPTKGQQELCAENISVEYANLEEVELSEETLRALREIGSILEVVVRRMEMQGVAIPPTMYAKNKRNKNH